MGVEDSAEYRRDLLRTAYWRHHILVDKSFSLSLSLTILSLYTCLLNRAYLNPQIVSRPVVFVENVLQVEISFRLCVFATFLKSFTFSHNDQTLRHAGWTVDYDEENWNTPTMKPYGNASLQFGVVFSLKNTTIFTNREALLVQSLVRSQKYKGQRTRRYEYCNKALVKVSLTNLSEDMFTYM